MLEILTKEHTEFEEFCARLEGPEGCNFIEKEEGNPSSIIWECSGLIDREHSIKILATMENIDIEKTLEYFNDHGGYCDCEILFNVPTLNIE